MKSLKLLLFLTLLLLPLRTVENVNVPIIIKKLNLESTINNNPFNLRYSNNQWLGKDTTNKGPFEKYTSIETGLRAGMITLRNYRKLHGLSSIRDIMNRYAPSHENDTKNYIKRIKSEIKRDTINLLDDNELVELSKVILELESGYKVSNEQLKQILCKY